MKKVFFAAYSLDVGGIETALITLIKHLSDKYEITLMLEKEQGIFLKSIPENVKIITYEASNNKIILFRKIINLIRQLKFKMKYKNKFDFSASFATYSFPCAFAARCASKNSAIWIHNDYMNFFNNDIVKYKDFFYDLKIDKFKKIIFVSYLDQKMFNVQFPKIRKRTYICHNLIEDEEILRKADEEITDWKNYNGITFINISRHDEKQKKISRIISATRKLNKEGYKFRVLLIGKGLDTKEYINNAKDLKNIEFLGIKKNPYPYLKNSDCMLLSSKFEGYPVVYIESEILKIPIVTTDVSDAKKDIEGKYGIVTENSEEGVYKGMKEFLEKGFKIQDFSAENYNEDIIDNLEKIINI